MNFKALRLTVDDGYYTYLSTHARTRTNKRFEREVLENSKYRTFDIAGVKDTKLREYLINRELYDEKFVY
jgi:hypothetical protein